MQADPSAVQFFAYISSAWVLLADTGGAVPVRFSWGISGNKPTDRVADPAAMTLYLNNSTGLYTPGGPSALAGFEKGIPVKMVVTFEGESYEHYYYLDDIDPQPSVKDKRVSVSLVGWMDYASRHPIDNPGVLTDKRGDEVLTTAVAEVEIQPQAMSFDTGRETFGTVFDANTSHTTVLSEAAKVAFSELGYVYEQSDGTFVFESADARPGWREPGTIKLPNADQGWLKKKDTSLSVFFDSTSGTGLAVDQTGKLTDDGSLSVNITDTTARYGVLTVAGDPQTMVVAAKVRVSELTMANNDLFVIFRALNAGANGLFAVQLQYTTVGGLKVNINARTDAATFPATSFYAIADGDEVKVAYAISTAPGANNGSAALYINGTLKETLASIDNDTIAVASLRFGAEAIDAGTSGYLYLDDIYWSLTDGGARVEDVDFEPGDLLLMSGGRILLNQTAAVTIGVDVPIMDFSAPYADDQVNHFTTIAYPRRLGASPEVLFELDSEITIGSGQTHALKGYWSDPNGGLPINAQDWIEPDPATATDCSAFTATGGGGSNITSSLTLNNWAPGTDGFSVDLYNGNAATMYLRTFKPRATAIRVFSPTQHVAKNAASIARWEAMTETIHQKYKSDTYAGRVFVESQVEQLKNPQTVLHSITFTANRSPTAMMAFLRTRIGDLRTITITELGIAQNYYIQGIEVQMSGKIITVTWIVVIALGLGACGGLSPVAVEFTKATPDGVDFGALPGVYSDATPETISMSIWFNLTDTTYGGDLIQFSTNPGGFGIYLIEFDATPKINVMSNVFNSQTGYWQKTFTPTGGVWHNMILAFNISSTANDPLVYYDSTLQTMTETIPPLGTKYTKTNVPLYIGNRDALIYHWVTAFNGHLFDPRVYNRILTQADVDGIFNAGVPDATAGTKDGLVFQAFAVPTGQLADYEDVTLTDAMRIFDGQFLSVGVPHGNPIGRAAP